MFGVLVVFCFSGLAGLLYQVVWQRMLVIFAGSDVLSATIVVAAFMAGLGCGSLVGGWAADRVSARSSLILFAAAESAIALFGLISRPVFYDFLYGRWGHLNIGLMPTAAILFAALLWPTFLMGASLPLLTRGMAATLGRAATTAGWLYTLNTFGAAAGALCGSWLLLPQIGLAETLRVAAGLNLGCAATIAVVAVSRANETRPGGHTHDLSSSVSGAGNVLPDSRFVSVSRWAMAYALAGFLGLSLEIVWFRILGVMLKSTSFTFGTLLGVYLLGLAVGGAIGSVLAPMVTRPGLWFAVSQAAAGTYSALSLMLFVAGLEPSGVFAWFGSYFAQYEGVDIPAALTGWGSLMSPGTATRNFMRLYLVLPVVLIGPPTIMAGLSFPLLQRVVQRDLAFLGRRTGVLLAANIFGGTLGALLTGWWLLGVAGTAGTLKVLFAASALFGLLAIDELRLRRTFTIGLAATVGALTLAVLITMPGGELLWARLHGTTPNQIVHGEDGSGLALLRTESGAIPRTMVFANGIGQSWIPYGDIHTVLGALPAFVHPHPRSAALIGLGSGDTLYALAGRQELRRITSIEIVGPQLDTLLRFTRRRQYYPPILSLEGDARISHVTGDGRSFLKRSRERYDIIEADALRPQSAFSGNLYSDAYFALLRDRLNPGGLAVTWAPTPRIVRTFVKVFPYVWQHGQVLMGSDAPIVVDRAAVVDRLTQFRVTSHFEWAGVELYPLLRPYISGGWREYGPSHDRSAIDDINTDLFPRDEFNLR